MCSGVYHSGWIRVAKLTSSVEDDAFGLSVDISGSTIVVGAWGDNFGKGAAYVFERTEEQISGRSLPN